MKYTYQDLITKRIRYTRGVFEGWTQPTGLLNVPYAIFKRPHSRLFVPTYLLTDETKTSIKELEAERQEQ